MKVIATRKSEQNRAIVDPWTLVHLGAGLALGLMNAPLRGSVAAAVAYELAEQLFERSEEGKELFDTNGPEIVPNAILDIVVFAAGHQLGQIWNKS